MKRAVPWNHLAQTKVDGGSTGSKDELCKNYGWHD